MTETFTENNIQELVVSYRPLKNGEPVIKSSADSYRIAIDNWDSGSLYMVEEVMVIYLDRRNSVKGIHKLAKGGITGCVVDIRVVLSIALKTLSTSLILIHNHPSGSMKPSTQDRSITENLKKACEVLNITFLDHLIISGEKYYSFADESLL